MDNLLVKNNQAEQRFEVEVDGHLAILNYQTRSDVFQIDYVYVPSAIGGRGIGKTLVMTALEWAKEKELRPVAVCSFARRFIP